jgi:hypothetical protein
MFSAATWESFAHSRQRILRAIRVRQQRDNLLSASLDREKGDAFK